jgi:hypothetical protein
MLCPLLFVTTSSAWFFSVFLMNRRRCFWFMQEAAWMCVSTCHHTDKIIIYISLKDKSSWYFKAPNTFFTSLYIHSFSFKESHTRSSDLFDIEHVIIIHIRIQTQTKHTCIKHNVNINNYNEIKKQNNK